MPLNRRKSKLHLLLKLFWNTNLFADDWICLRTPPKQRLKDTLNATFVTCMVAMKAMTKDSFVAKWSCIKKKQQAV